VTALNFRQSVVYDVILPSSKMHRFTDLTMFLTHQYHNVYDYMM